MKISTNISFLVIIPARCGSKGIKFKNIIDIRGKPLIEYSITPALKLLSKKIVNKVIVSTDCEKIRKISENLGAEVPFLRPKEIAGDISKSIELILHALNFYEDKDIFFDSVVVLQPTSPLREYTDIKTSIELFNKQAKGESLISCYKEDSINELILYKKKDIFAIPINPLHNKGVRRQDRESIYVRNGAIYITSVKYLKETSQIISDTPLIYEMTKIKSINLDTEEDLKILERLL